MELQSLLRVGLYLVQLVAAAFAFWFGLYVLSRVGRFAARGSYTRRPGDYVGAATLCLGIYLLGVAMETTAADDDEFLLWQRLTWWASALGVSLFLLSILRWSQELTGADGRSRARYVDGAWLAVTAVIAAGTILEWYNMPADVTLSSGPVPMYFTPQRLPHYFAFVGFVLGQLALATAIIVRLWRRALVQANATGDLGFWHSQAELHILLGAALAILGGATISVIGVPGVNQGGIPRTFGMIGITAGACLIGYAVVRHQAFIHDKTVVRDFRLALLRFSGTLFLYGGGFVAIFALLPYRLEPVVPAVLVVLLVMVQALAPLQERRLSRLVLPRWMVDYQAQIEQVRVDPVLTPQPDRALAAAAPTVTHAVIQAVAAQRQSTLDAAIEDLFRYNRFNDDVYLHDSPLAGLLGIPASDASHPAATATQLRRLLTATIDRELAESTADDAGTLSDATVGLVILRNKYVEQKSRQQVEQYLLDSYGAWIRGGAYSRSLTAGRHRLAQALAALP
jgi:hypothetical protein